LRQILDPVVLLKLLDDLLPRISLGDVELLLGLARQQVRLDQRLMILIPRPLVAA